MEQKPMKITGLQKDFPAQAARGGLIVDEEVPTEKVEKEKTESEAKSEAKQK
jgi:hypothetical protein